MRSSIFDEKCFLRSADSLQVVLDLLGGCLGVVLLGQPEAVEDALLIELEQRLRYAGSLPR